jgi:hypothetical protein
MKSTKTPFYIKALGWLIALFAFALGFWHTHHGLKPMKPLGTEYGSFVVAGLITMVLVVAYRRAIGGMTSAIVFYLICALFNFTFNTNSFYPTLLGRKLMTEETVSIRDTMVNYAAKLNKVCSEFGDINFSDLDKLETHRDNLIAEISKRGGFGPYATEELSRFNAIAGTVITPDRDLGATQAERDEKVARFRQQLNQAIDNYIVTKLGGQDQKKRTLVLNRRILDSTILPKYIPLLDSIILDNSEIKLNDSTKYHPQINTLQQAVNDIDVVCANVNKAYGSVLLKPLNDNKSQNQAPKIQYLGSFEHTIESVAQRIGRIDTWGILLLVLFIDFIVPLAIFFMIRSGEDGESASSNDWFSRLFGKKKPQTF